MKRTRIFLFFILILFGYSLLGCNPSGSAYDKLNCSPGGEICIKATSAQTFIKGNPLTINIIVTSLHDYSDLYVKLQTPHDVTVDGPGTWENYLLSKSIEPVYATWDVSIKANQTLTFSRVLHFPMIDGEYWVGVSVVSVSVEGFGTDSFYVFITNDRGAIVKAGTPIPPLTPLIAATVYGPGTPVPTYIPSATLISPQVSMTATLQSVPLVSTSTPLTSPYPPPPTATPLSSPYP